MGETDPAAPLEGRTFVVTGASRGLGREMAVALAGAGARVLATGRDELALAQTLARGGGAIEALPLDVRDADAVEQAAADAWARAGAVHGIFNNAGISLVKPALDVTAAELEEVLRTNVVGLFNCCKSFGARMLDQGHGTIVNIASDIGLRGSPNFSAYSASKGAVITLTKSLAWEWAPTLRVNAIAPGAFTTDLTRDVLAEHGEHVIAETPLKRIGVAHEIGPLAVFMAGDGASFMTGTVVSFDGGIRKS